MTEQEFLTELHEKAYKNNQDSGCLTRSQLLFLALKDLGLKPNILRYFVKGEKDKDSDKREKLLRLQDNFKHISHVVVELEGNILDPNLGRIIKKEDYEKELSEINPVGVEFVPYGLDVIKIDEESYRRDIDSYNLEKFKSILHFLRFEQKVN